MVVVFFFIFLVACPIISGFSGYETILRNYNMDVENILEENLIVVVWKSSAFAAFVFNVLHTLFSLNMQHYCASIVVSSWQLFVICHVLAHFSYTICIAATNSLNHTLIHSEIASYKRNHNKKKKKKSEILNIYY